MTEALPNSEPLRVFVYGTLKPGGTYWSKYCEGRVSKFVPAKIPGLLYALNAGYPGLVKAEEGCWVSGFLLTLKDESVLSDFDQLEAYSANRSSTENEYDRVWTPVFSLAGKALGHCWTYYMELSKVESMGGVFLERGQWSESIQQTIAFPRQHQVV